MPSGASERDVECLQEHGTWQGTQKPGRIWQKGVPNGSASLMEALGSPEATWRLLRKAHTNQVFVKEPQYFGGHRYICTVGGISIPEHSVTRGGFLTMSLG